MLLSWHNIAFYQALTAAMRAAIAERRFEGFRRDFHTGLDKEAVRKRPAHRYAHHRPAGAFDAVGRGLAPMIIHANHGCAALLDAGDQALLDGGVARERTVTIEMILADIEQDAD